MGSRDHFMEGATCQTRARKMAINLRQAERQLCRRSVGKRAFQSRDGLPKSGDTVATAGVLDWLHGSKLDRR
jgi:hypothetical protein